MPAANVHKEIQRSVGISNDKNPSPPIADAIQSINHISVAAPYVIASISKWSAFLSFKKYQTQALISASANATRKYIFIYFD